MRKEQIGISKWMLIKYNPKVVPSREGLENIVKPAQEEVWGL